MGESIRTAGRSFTALYGREPECVASAPGCVRLLGDDAESTGGLALPIAIPLRTTVAVATRNDRNVSVCESNAPGSERRGSYELGGERREGDWLDEIRGVTFVLAAAGYVLRGCDLRIERNVPRACGLSASGSVVIAVLRALHEALVLGIDEVALALLGCRVESEFIQAASGVADPMAAALCSDDTALLLDTAALSFDRVQFPAAAGLIVIDSRLAHGSTDTERFARRNESREAARMLGVSTLRDVGEQDLPRVMHLPDPFARRVRHVVTENQRVHSGAAAMRAGDAVTLGRLLDASHHSRRDDFDMTLPELDFLCEEARDCDAIFGARVTGADLGGVLVAVTDREHAARVAPGLLERYSKRTGRAARLVTPPSDESVAGTSYAYEAPGSATIPRHEQR